MPPARDVEQSSAFLSSFSVLVSCVNHAVEIDAALHTSSREAGNSVAIIHVRPSPRDGSEALGSSRASFPSEVSY